MTRFVHIFAILSLTQSKIEAAIKSTVPSDIADTTSKVNNNSTKIIDDVLFDFKALALKYCAKSVETYHITTLDGYILTVFRIPGNAKQPVIISHGLTCTADDFIIRGLNSLICVLAKQGYDVWTLNYRGSRYSRKHATLNPNIDSRFWDYSMHEMGNYDLPAVIDVVLKTTGQSQLSIVGHSEGTSTVFILLSTRPEYNNKIKIVIALSPVAYLTHSTVARTFLVLLPLIKRALNTIFYKGEIMGSATKSFINTVCSMKVIGFNLCYNTMFSTFGGHKHANSIEPDFFDNVVLSHWPDGTSGKNILHFLQVCLAGMFKQYDYGSEVNYQKYGSKDPPLYDLGKVSCPVALIVTQQDKIVALADVVRLNKELPNVVSFITISDPNFTHLAFMWANNLHDVLMPEITLLLEKYN